MPFVRPELYKAIAANDIAGVVFQDPFTEEARKAKRNLVAASFGALLIASLELQVSGFLGLQTVTGAALGGSVTKGLAFLVNLYFLAGFILSAYIDYSAWKFKREQVLVQPYLELVKMLEAHFHVTGEQVDNATARLKGVLVERGMQSEVEFKKILDESQGQLSSIQRNTSALHEEIRPLLAHWTATIKKFDHLSWRMRARFISLWLLDITLPLMLTAVALWQTHSGLAALWSQIAA